MGKEDKIMPLLAVISVFALLLVHIFDDDRHINAKLTECCERVALYEATKHTDDVRGHRDFDDDMECGE